MSKIRVLIVDDHAIMREGIRLILAPHEEIEVVAHEGLTLIVRRRQSGAPPTG